MQEYFTIEEVAELLGFTLEQVQKEIKKDELVCAWRIHNPLEGKDGTTGADCSLPAGVYVIGVFPYSENIKIEEMVAGEETGNYYNAMQSFRYLKWGGDKIARVNELSVYELCDQKVFIQDEWAEHFHNIEHTLAKPVRDWGVVAKYVLHEPITVSMENVLIPKWSLKKYLEKSGRDLDTEIPIGREKDSAITEEDPTPIEQKAALAARQQNARKKRQRTNAMAEEIDNILNNGTNPTVKAVWKELVERCAPEGPCCIAVHETNEGTAIKWRSDRGLFKNLTKKNLEDRLKRSFYKS